MFTGVLHTDIDSVWHEVLPLIDSACETGSNRTDSAEYYERLKARNCQLWIYRSESGIELCVITSIESYKHKKYCRLCVVTGQARENWQHNLEKIEQWAMAQGCHGMESLARKGWGKILKDYKTTHIFIEKEF